MGFDLVRYGSVILRYDPGIFPSVTGEALRRRRASELSLSLSLVDLGIFSEIQLITCSPDSRSILPISISISDICYSLTLFRLV